MVLAGGGLDQPMGGGSSALKAIRGVYQHLGQTETAPTSCSPSHGGPASLWVAVELLVVGLTPTAPRLASSRGDLRLGLARP